MNVQDLHYCTILVQVFFLCKSCRFWLLYYILFYCKWANRFSHEYICDGPVDCLDNYTATAYGHTLDNDRCTA